MRIAEHRLHTVGPLLRALREDHAALPRRLLDAATVCQRMPFPNRSSLRFSKPSTSVNQRSASVWFSTANVMVTTLSIPVMQSPPPV
jgi:hypothetical protein